MEEPQQLIRRDTANAPVQGRSSLLKSVTFRRGNASSGDSSKGAIGLTTVFQPLKQVTADLVFIHGLGGGSRKTWAKNEDPNLFWPGEFLPQDDEFQDARIHTFGYDANWSKESILNIHDFAKNLLFSLKDCPAIPRDERAPIVFICHSLGGLVAKRAYILSKQFPEYESVRARVRAIFFLATPHRGSNMAELLSKIIQVTITVSARPFVNELQPNSATIQSINDEFPHHAQELDLYSFYETDSMHLGVRKALIVPKDSAVLGYPNERSTFLNANHREVCKFDDKGDSNYLSIKNALAAALEEIRKTRPIKRQESNFVQHEWLKQHLEVNDSFEDEFQRIDSERIDGSCQWIAQEKSFLDWRDSEQPQLFWLQAKPGTGKSVTTSFVIDHLREMGIDCAMHFFVYGDKSRLDAGNFLRSIAWQISNQNVRVFEAMLKICQRDVNIARADYRTVWRKLFVDCIFNVGPPDKLCIVIDALDECASDTDLVPLLLKAVDMKALRVFLTTRNTFESYGVSSRLRVQTQTIPLHSTTSDIRLFVESNTESLPTLGQDEEAGHENMINSIVQRSNGCFLWVRLVINELRRVHTATEVEKILEDAPADMDDLYIRILDNMSALQYGKDLTRALLTWVAGAVRPMDVQELQQAIQFDIDDKLDSIERAISTTCGQLIYVDGNSYVKMIHLTAREFLLSDRNDSYFCMSKKEVHTRLATVCLKYLSSREMAPPGRKRLSLRRGSQERSSFVNYASNSLADHINFVSSEDDEFLSALTSFLGSQNVLTWIEYLAQSSKLHRLAQTGRAIRHFLRRRQKYGYLAIGRDFALLDAWSTDMERLVPKFGGNLSASPWSIYNLIPPFCPAESALKKYFGSSNRSLNVEGLSSPDWDDCISVFLYQKRYPSALASSSSQFAVGFNDGTIKIYDVMTCQDIQDLSHGEGIKGLKYGETDQFMVSIAFKSICVWDVVAWRRLWRFDLEDRCMDISFLDEDCLLLASLRNNALLLWDLTKGTWWDLDNWLDLSEDPTNQAPQLFKVSVLGGADLIAVNYRGEDIVVWDIGEQKVVDILASDVGSRGPFASRRRGRTFLFDMVINQSAESGLLAASYCDGELIVYDFFQNLIRARATINVHFLTCSPDGITLACGNSAGLIALYEFDSLHLLYRVTSEGFGIRSLAFSVDSCRLIDVRGRSARVWEPPALRTIRQGSAVDDTNSDTISVSTTPEEQSLGNVEQATEVSALLCLHNYGWIVCGKSDGSIRLYDSKTGAQVEGFVKKADNIPITSLNGNPDASIFIAVDGDNRIYAYKIASIKGGRHVVEVLRNRPRIPPRQVVLNSSSTNVLIASLDCDIVYDLTDSELTELASHTWPERHRFRWAHHTSSPDQLILIMDSIAHIFAWSTFTQLTPDVGIHIANSIIPELVIKSIVPHNPPSNPSSSVLAATYSESLTSRARTSRLFLFYTSDFRPDSTSAEPIPHSQALAAKIECIIGTLGPRLVFLHQDGWVCSADLSYGAPSSSPLLAPPSPSPKTLTIPTTPIRKTSSPSNKSSKDDSTSPPSYFDSHIPIDRHFFFPADWLTSPKALLLALLPNGDIAFAQRDEVAIIKRGLEKQDAASAGQSGLAAIRSGSSTQRPSLSQRRSQMGGSISLREKLGAMRTP